ncbi:thiamine diphosphokinase [Enterococcus sp. LJL98]
MNVLLVAGGTVEHWPRLQDHYDIYIGIDRGSLYLLEAGYPLDLAIGDFDSLSAVEKAFVFKKAKKVQMAPAEKDETDTQLALGYALRHYPTAKIELIGVTGGRLDHLLSNLWMIFEPRFKKHSNQICLRDAQNTVTYLLPGNHQVKRIPMMKYLGYCCLTPIRNLTLTDSKYTLKQVDIDYPTSLASNEFLGETAQISFDAGLVAVIQSRDK